jgi:hypothetical protein
MPNLKIIGIAKTQNRVFHNIELHKIDFLLLILFFFRQNFHNNLKTQGRILKLTRVAFEICKQ